MGVDWFSYTIPIIHLFSDWPISIHLWVYNQLGFCFVLFLTYYSVECQTKSLSNLCFRFAMLPIFLAILKFCTIQRLFYYFRQRYTKDEIGDLNNAVKLRGKLRSVKFSISFYQLCLANRVAPRFITARISKSSARHSPTIERSFIKDEIHKAKTRLLQLRNMYQRQWSKVRRFLSFFDMVRFSRYLSEIDQRTEKQTMQKHHRNVGLLVRKRFGHLLSNPKKHILNLSDYSLSDTEEFVLEHGLEFCIPPRDINREETFAEFEILIAQLARHNPVSDNELSSLKARLSDLAHAYCGTPIDLTDFRMHREHFQAIKSLRNNKDILITKPDKGSGVVILNQKDYITKMGDVLNDNSKFEKLGDVEQFDKTARLEQKLQKRLLELVNKKQLARGIYDRIRPTGSQRPRMYGLPKTHKQSIPLRPILSMVGSAQHQLAKWLSEVLEPVLHLYSENCISDSFTFAKFIQNLELNPTKTFMCSFDVSSLFTNVPLDETIKICADALYRSELERPSFPEEVFIELMKSATSSVEFSFNNEMYRQKDGVAMGSPLGPALANIFVGFHEHKLFNCHQKPLVYFRYVDDTFAVFEKESECDIFLAKLNSLHQSLKFTFEKEENNSLPFLDVSVEKTEPGFLTSVYRKPTFSGLYTRWDSFCAKQIKINLINTLVHRALMICSEPKLNLELA